jgi:hypothetical protein
MTVFSRFMTCAVVLCLGTATRAAAEPIQVTGGSLTAFWQGIAAGGLAPTAIVGSRGFSLTGDALPGEGRMDVFDLCTEPCSPGTLTPSTMQSLGAFVGAFRATATLDGTSYEITESINSPTVVSLELEGTAAIPAFAERNEVVMAPFSMTGLFSSEFGPIGESLAGGGTATLFLSPIHLPPGDLGSVWRVDRIRYEFGASTVTPEPGTLVLAGLGLMAAASRFRARRALR